MRAFWILFSSMKTAIVLLLTLAAVSILGTIEPLGLANLYHSIWYLILLSLIGLNLVVCSVNRFGVAWRHTRVSGRVGVWGTYLTHLSILVIFAGAILGSRLGFEGRTYIAEGGSTETYWAKRDNSEKNLGFRVALRKFTIEHDKDRNATGYRSDLAVYDGRKLTAQKVIDVNRPLTYKGVSFLQSDYGLDCLVIKIKAPTGETAWLPYGMTTRDEPEGRQYMFTDVPLKQIGIGGRKLAVFVHNFAPDYVGGEQINASLLPINPAANIMVNDRFPEYKGLDAWTNLGWLEESSSADYKGFKITVEEVVDYTVLQVTKNPGIPVIYAGFGLMLMGIFISFYMRNPAPSTKPGVSL